MQTLLPFQEEAVKLLTEKNFLLADDAGLGKTLMAIEAAKRAARGPILVVCPRTVKPWWAQTIREQEAGYVGVTRAAGRGVRYEVLDAQQARASMPLWVVTHPEAVRLSWKDLKKVHWDWIIVDEAHRFKNRKAQQTKALWRIPCEHRKALTATPYGKSPADMWALLHWLHPEKYTSYWRFFNEYVESYQPPRRNFHIIKGPKNLRALAKEVAPFYLRRRKSDALNLPPFTEHNVPVMMAPQQDTLYKTLLKEAYAELQGQEVVLENALLRVLRLQQCALDPTLMVEDKGKWGEVPGKVLWLQEWLDDHPNEPVIIVSRFRKFVERWLEGLAPGACIVGGMAQYKIQAALARFRETGVLVGSLQAMCEGLNLQRANTMIVTDGTWSPVQAYQLAQRIHRIGQHHPCQVLHLCGRKTGKRGATVDDLLRRSLTAKWTQARMVDTFIKEVQNVQNNSA